MANFAEELGLIPAAGAPAPAAPAPAPTGEPAAPTATPAAPAEGSLLGRVAGDVGQTVLDAVPATIRGVSKGMQEMDRAAFDVGDWLNNNILDAGHIAFTKGGIKWVNKSNGFSITGDGVKSVPGEAAPTYDQEAAITKPLASVTPGPVDSVGGGMIEGVSQFLTGFALGGRLLGTVAKGFKGAQLVQSGAQTMFSATAAFDPSEERLSNLINESTPFGNAVTEYLAHSGDESRAEGRFKNAIEQLSLNLPLEAVFLAVKGVKLKRAGKLEEAQKLSDEVAKELEAAHTSSEAVPHPDAAPAPGGDAGMPDIKFSQAQRAPRGPSTPFEPAPEIVGADGKNEPFKTQFKWGATNADDLLARYGKLRDDPTALDTAANKFVHTNLGMVRDANDAKALFNEFGKIATLDFERAKGPKITDADYAEAANTASKELADWTGTDWRQMQMMAAGDHAALKDIYQRIIGYRAGTAMVARRSADLANSIVKGDFSEFAGQAADAKKAFLQNLVLQHSIAPTTEGIKSELGRNLQALGRKIGPDGQPAPKLPGISDEAKAAAEAATPKAQAVEGAKAAASADINAALAGDTQSLDRVIKRIALAGDNTKASMKITRDFLGKGAMDVHNELLINALLSGPKTSVVNMVTSFIKSSVVMPSEQMLAGIISRDMATFRMGADQYAGMAMSLRDAWRTAGQAMKAGDPILDTTHQGMGASRHAIVPETFGLNEDTPLGAFVSGLGALVRLPSRMLTTEDEFLKQLTYRSRLYAMGMREARAMKDGHGSPPPQLADFISQYMERGFDENGAATNPEALAWARDATFTNDLKVETWGGGRSFGQTMSELANNHPAMRAIMPFVRVPTNIMRDAWDHTPGMNYLRAQWRAELNAGGERAALAKSKLLTGGAMWATMADLAFNGDIVGSMPSDPTIARAWKDAGIVQNSIRYTKEDSTYGYISFARFDPYSIPLSLAATYADLTRGTENWKTEDIAGGMVSALAKNLESKTYLQGIVNLLGVLSDPDNKMEAFLKNQAAAYIPSATNTFKGNDYLLDPHTMAQAMLAKTSNYGQVDRKFNLVGEPVQIPHALGPDWLSPIAVGGENDPTLSELARLATVHKGGLGYPAKKLNADLDLTQIQAGAHSAYDRMQELSGTMTVGGKTLRDRLEGLFNSDGYKTKMTDGDPDANGSRINEVRALLQTYRQSARELLMRENPEFHQKYVDHLRRGLEVQRFGATPQ